MGLILGIRGGQIAITSCWGGHRWRESERALIRAELDAAFFILYGLPRDAIDYVLSTFQGVAQEDEREGGVGQTRQLINEALDRMRDG